MKVLVYSAKEFEIPFINRANRLHLEILYNNQALNINTAHLCKGFDCIAVSAGDDVSAHVLRELKLFGVKYVVTRCATFNNIDMHEAESLDIRIANVPEYSPYAVAEHSAAILLALFRKLPVANAQVHRYNFSIDKLVGTELHNKTVGIIGTGSVGSIVAKIMSGFGCEVLAHDINPSKDLAQQYNIRYCTLQELCLRSDIVSIHVPLTDQTKNLLNAKLFSIMKKGVTIINTANDALINTADLLKYIDNKIIGAYGTDVYETEENINSDQVLKNLLARENVLITPRQAFATYESLSNIADTTLSNISEWAAGATPANEISHSATFISYAK